MTRPSARLVRHLGFLAWLVGRGIRADFSRTVLTLVIGTVGVLVLLGGAAVVPAAQHQRDTAAALLPVPSGLSPDSATPGLFIENSREFYRGATVTIYRIAALGDTSLRPPGVPALPAPGTVVVSPALAEVIDKDPVLRQRIPERVVGTIGRAGVPGPRQLLAWTGASVAELKERHVGVTVGFEDATSADLVVPSAVRVGAPFMIVAFLVPLIALFSIVATAGGDRRSRRLAALRLCGLRAVDARRTAVAEALALGAASGILGISLFLVLGSRLAPVVPIGSGSWPDEVELVPWAALAALLGVPLLAGVVVARATRGSMSDPVATSRTTPAEGPVRRSGGWLLLIGVAAVALVDPVRSVSGVDTALALLVVGLLVSLGGILVGTRWVAMAAARRVGSRTGSVSQLVAGRHVSRHPRAAAKVATGVALLVFFGGILLSFFPLLSDADAEQAARLETVLGADTLVATTPSIAVAKAARSVEGTAGFLEMRVGEESNRTAWISCPDLARFTGATGCHDELADKVVTELRSSQLLPLDLDPERTATPPAGGVAEVNVVVVPKPGSDVERTRAGLLRAGLSDVVTTDERRAERQLDTETFRQATLVALACAGFVALGSLVAGLFDHVARQRHAFRMLAVLGTSNRQLGRVLIAQTVVSVAPAVAVSWAVGMLAAVQFLRLNDTSHLLPSLPASFAVLAGALLTPLIAAALASRSLSGIINERTES